MVKLKSKLLTQWLRTKSRSTVGLTFLLLSFASFAGDTSQFDKLATSLGVVEVIRMPVLDEYGNPTEDLSLPDTIAVNEKKVFRSEAFYIGLYKSFELSNGVAILFGINPGGSATPVDSLNFLLLRPNRNPVVISKDNFYSANGSIISRQNHDDVIIDLGYENKMKKSALLRDGEITIQLEPVGLIPMKDDDCRWLHEYTLGECIDAKQKYKQDCREFGKDYSGASVAVMTSITLLSNEPGFVSNALDTICINACNSGKSVDYDQFKKSVCSIK